MTERTVVEEVSFDGLSIRVDDRVLRPRGWTVLQSAWATELLGRLPPGPVLELCCGAGQIGLAAVRRTTRALVCVDRDPVAAAYAAENAVAAGMADRVELRTGDLAAAVGAGEAYPLVLADPPWVPRALVQRHPGGPGRRHRRRRGRPLRGPDPPAGGRPPPGRGWGGAAPTRDGRAGRGALAGPRRARADLARAPGPGAG